jgi:hypothetical protein
LYLKALGGEEALPFPKTLQSFFCFFVFESTYFSTPNILWSIKDTLCMQTLGIQSFKDLFVLHMGGKEGKGPHLILRSLP